MRELRPRYRRRNPCGSSVGRVLSPLYPLKLFMKNRRRLVISFIVLLARLGAVVLSKYSNCLKQLAESDWAGHDNLGLAAHITKLLLLSPTQFDLLHILVTEKSVPTKTARKSAQFRNSPHSLWSGSVTTRCLG